MEITIHGKIVSILKRGPGISNERRHENYRDGETITDHATNHQSSERSVCDELSVNKYSIIAKQTNLYLIISVHNPCHT